MYHQKKWDQYWTLNQAYYLCQNGTNTTALDATLDALLSVPQLKNNTPDMRVSCHQDPRE